MPRALLDFKVRQVLLVLLALPDLKAFKVTRVLLERGHIPVAEGSRLAVVVVGVVSVKKIVGGG
ncbi:hypothetical protein, partial [Bacillus cereus group sp. N17]|uniref:hypothetical protein n=1 Tax=Bacillus cereus group sp. N17 TaxID=2794589 RepID=UPI0023DF22E7